MKKNNNNSLTPSQKQVTIRIDNLKCGGCATSIEMGLLALQGVTKAHVIENTGEVEISYDEGTDLTTIKNKLKQLGYPEAGTTQGLEKIAANIKSYISCATGKLSEKED